MPDQLVTALTHHRVPRVATVALAITALMISAVVSPRLGAQSSAASTDSSTVVSTAARFHAALAAGDSIAALALLAPDAIVLESGGVETLADYRGHHLPADIAFARAVPSTRSVVRAEVRGDAAWVTATSETRGTYRDRPIDSRGAELMVLSRYPEGWRIRAIHWSSRARRPSN